MKSRAIVFVRWAANLVCGIVVLLNVSGLACLADARDARVERLIVLAPERFQKSLEDYLQYKKELRPDRIRFAGTGACDVLGSG